MTLPLQPLRQAAHSQTADRFKRIDRGEDEEILTDTPPAWNFYLVLVLSRFQETNLGCSPVHQAELRKLNKAGEICEEKADKQSAWVQRLFAPATEKTALPARLLSSACLLGEWETEASRPKGMEFSHAALTGVVVCLVLSVGSQCLRSSCCCYWLFPDHLKSVGWKYSLLASALPLLATLGQKQVINNELDDLN